MIKYQHLTQFRINTYKIQNTSINKNFYIQDNRRLGCSKILVGVRSETQQTTENVGLPFSCRRRYANGKQATFLNPTYAV